MTETLMIIEGSNYHRCGNTKVIGAGWCKDNDPRMQICCSHVSGVHIYHEIEFSDFRYILSRMRSRERVIQKRWDKLGVFINLEGIWFGKDKVVDMTQPNFDIDLEELEILWDNYWSNK